MLFLTHSTCTPSPPRVKLGLLETLQLEFIASIEYLSVVCKILGSVSSAAKNGRRRKKVRSESDPSGGHGCEWDTASVIHCHITNVTKTLQQNENIFL